MLEYQKDLDLFQAALGIEEPWYVQYREFDKENGLLHVYLDFRSGAMFVCPQCQSSRHKVYDVVNEDRTWRHLNFFEYTTLLHARLPRVECHDCNKVLTVHVDWSRPRNRFTLKFETYVLSLMKEMPVAAVAREVKEHDTRLWRIFHYYVNQAMENMDVSKVTRVALDETSSRRGHSYITLFVDIDTKRVLYATEGKGAETVLTFKGYLEHKGVPSTQIKEFCSDMSPAFISGITEFFPHASITFDKFHVMKMVNEAVDTVRKEEQKETPLLKKTRYLWLKNQVNLKHDQQEKLLKLKDTNLKTAKAYRLKLALQDLWSIPQILADVYLNEWIQWTKRTRLQPMIEAAQSIKKHEDGVLRWFTTRMTNGLLEGINSLVQASKRKARGYRTLDTFISMVYATANKLEIEVKPY